jgi:cytochrome c oxidase assembly protein subunit 15
MREPVHSGSGYHRFAAVLACLVVGLIAAGALVTSKSAGLAVPDWPLSYGSLNPPRWWEIENVRAEHGHRLYAGTVALLTVGLAVGIGRREPRRWVRRLAWTAVGAVAAQALLGGITVLLFLPTAVSVGHAALAEIFLCLVVTLAVVTSQGWREPSVRETSDPIGGSAPIAATARLATATTAIVYGQILVGAVMRHLGAGLAIPDFPLAFGRLVPPRFDLAIGVAYAHRVGALLVLFVVAGLAGRILARHRGEPGLRRPALALIFLVAVQIALGGAVVLGGRAVPVNTLHVATGATLLATSLVLTLRTRRRAWLRRATAPVGAGEGTAAREAAA